jgi:O-antigen ligase
MTGTGLGQPFNEVVTLPSISFFKEYRFMPHNSILGLWAFTGVIGFTGISLALIVAVFLAGRSYRLARSPDERTAAFMVLGVAGIYLVHCWGDIGFSERRAILLLGPMLGIAGQLATATGAWATTTRPVKAVQKMAA